MLVIEVRKLLTLNTWPRKLLQFYDIITAQEGRPQIWQHMDNDHVNTEYSFYLGKFWKFLGGSLLT